MPTAFAIFETVDSLWELRIRRVDVDAFSIPQHPHNDLVGLRQPTVRRHDYAHWEANSRSKGRCSFFACCESTKLSCFFAQYRRRRAISRVQIEEPRRRLDPT